MALSPVGEGALTPGSSTAHSSQTRWTQIDYGPGLFPCEGRVTLPGHLIYWLERLLMLQPCRFMHLPPHPYCTWIMCLIINPALLFKRKLLYILRPVLSNLFRTLGNSFTWGVSTALLWLFTCIWFALRGSLSCYRLYARSRHQDAMSVSTGG